MSKRTFKRRLTAMIAIPLVKLMLFVIWKSCRVTKVLGAQHMDTVLETGKPFIPCYWHQQHIFGAWYMLQQQKRGLKLGFLISPSSDGEIASRLVEKWGATPIRGSSNRTGAKAMRDMFGMITKQGVSPVTTSDGPTGPPQVFKQGAVMLSQLTQAPMLPIACACSNAWYLPSWDRFMIPKPFSRIVIAVGAPILAEKGRPMTELEPIRLAMEQSINGLIDQAKQAL